MGNGKDPINYWDCVQEARYIRSSIISEVDLYAKWVKEKFLPTFDSLNEEANKFGEEQYENLLQNADPEHADPGDLASEADDRSIDFYISMDAVHQGFINLFAAGLYHLFEQHLKAFYVDHWLVSIIKPAGVFPMSKRIGFEPNFIYPVVDSLEENGIIIRTFSTWPTINGELRELANTIKHAEGEGCRNLKEINPNLFYSPRDPAFSHSGIPTEHIRVRHPLIGENLFVRPDDFQRYVEAVQGWWKELAEKLPDLGNRLAIEPDPPKKSKKMIWDKGGTLDERK